MLTAEQLMQLIQQQQQQHEQQMQIILDTLKAMASGPRAQAVVPLPPAFPSFKSEIEEWKSYLSRLEQHFLCHQVKDENIKRAFLLSMSGNGVSDLLFKLCQEEDISRVPYGTIISKLTEYYARSPYVVANRFNFFQSRLKQGQTLAEWVSEMKGLAKGCNFVCRKEGCSTS